jgi:hypothetical protein
MRAVHHKKKASESAALGQGRVRMTAQQIRNRHVKTHQITRPRTIHVPNLDILVVVTSSHHHRRPDRPSPEPERQRGTGLKPHPAP